MNNAHNKRFLSITPMFLYHAFGEVSFPRAATQIFYADTN